jgi:hypothetical protein
MPAGLLDWSSTNNLHFGVEKNLSYGPLFKQQRSQ